MSINLSTNSAVKVAQQPVMKELIIVDKLIAVVNSLFLKYQYLVNRTGVNVAHFFQRNIINASLLMLYPLKYFSLGQKIRLTISYQLGEIVRRSLLLVTKLLKDLPVIAVIIGGATLVAMTIHNPTFLFIATVSTITYLVHSYHQYNRENERDLHNKIHEKTVKCFKVITNTFQEVDEKIEKLVGYLLACMALSHLTQYAFHRMGTLDGTIALGLGILGTARFFYLLYKK